MDKQKVEFIESYIKIGNGDYQWNDNHGELIRYKDCKHRPLCEEKIGGKIADDDWFCADGEKEVK